VDPERLLGGLGLAERGFRDDVGGGELDGATAPESPPATDALAAAEGAGSGAADPGAALAAAQAAAAAHLARVGELEGRLAELTGQLDQVTARAGELQGQLALAVQRALRAEHPDALAELIAGSTVQEVEASVEVAKAAYTRALEAARRELAGQSTPAGNPPREAADAAAVEGLSPIGKIAAGIGARRT